MLSPDIYKISFFPNLTMMIVVFSNPIKNANENIHEQNLSVSIKSQSVDQKLNETQRTERGLKLGCTRVASLNLPYHFAFACLSS